MRLYKINNLSIEYSILKIFKTVCLYFALSSSFVCASDKPGDFGWIKKGFLVGKSLAPVKSAQPDAVPVTTVSTRVAPFVSKEIELISGELRKYHLESGLESSLIAGMKTFFSKIGAGDLVGAFSSSEGYYAWLKVRSLKNSSALFLEHEVLDAAGDGIPMQRMRAHEVLDHLFVSSLLKYLDTLSDGERPGKEIFLRHLSSNLSCGKLITMDWSRYFPSHLLKSDPAIGYYQDTTLPDKPYRIYFFGNGKDYMGAKLTHSEDLNAYQWGELSIFDHKFGPQSSVQDGFILNKKGELLAESGFALFASTEREDDKRQHYLRYEFDVELGRMVFRTPDPKYYRAIQDIIDIAGGIKQIEREKLIFIPDSEYSLERGWKIARDDSEALLPFFYALKENQKHKSLRPFLEDVIDLMRKSLGGQVRTELMTVDLKQRAGGVLKASYPSIPSPEITKPESLELPSVSKTPPIMVLPKLDFLEAGKAGEAEPVSMPEIDVVDSSSKAESAISDTVATSTSQTSRNKKKSVVRKLPKTQAASVRPQKRQASAARKTPEIDKIEEAQLEKLKGLKHLDSSAVGAILSEMAMELGKVGFSVADKSTSVGSHHKKCVTAQDTGAETAMAVARRPIREGFNVWTVRTIIKKFATRVRSITEKKPEGKK